MNTTPASLILAAANPAASPAANAPPISQGLWNGGTPFIDPMNIHNTWWLTLIPLAFFLSLAYKAVRAKSVQGLTFFRGVATLTLQIVLGMIGLAAALHLFLAITPLLT